MESTIISRSADLRNENRRRLLNTLRLMGPCSPARLASDTCLSAASISSLSTQLAEQGIVTSSRQNGHGDNVPRGRPQTLIELNASVGDVITLNLAIDRICVCRVNYAGQILDSQILELRTRELSESELMEVVTNAIDNMMQIENGNPVQCIGVAFQGATKQRNGALSWSPIIQPQNINLGALLEANFAVPVSVNSDSWLITEALSRHNHTALGDSFAAVIFSHGVGLGLQLGGKPFSGIRSSALEMGHLRFERNGAQCRCGKKGCIEAYAADYGILRLAGGDSIDDTPPGHLDTEQTNALCSAAQSGDEAAVQAFVIAGAAIGEGLATIFSLFDSMPVAIVGRNPQAVDLMLPGVKSAFRDQRGDPVVIQDMLHCFDDENALLESGLIVNALTKADLQFAYGG